MIFAFSEEVVKFGLRSNCSQNFYYTARILGFSLKYALITRQKIKACKARDSRYGGYIIKQNEEECFK